MPSEITINALRKLKGWLVLGGSPSANNPTNANHDMGFALEADDKLTDFSARLELLHIFFEVLENHPDDKDLFFQVITKIVDSKNPATLTKKEKKSC